MPVAREHQGKHPEGHVQPPLQHDRPERIRRPDRTRGESVDAEHLPCNGQGRMVEQHQQVAHSGPGIQRQIRESVERPGSQQQRVERPHDQDSRYERHEYPRCTVDHEGHEAVLWRCHLSQDRVSHQIPGKCKEHHDAEILHVRHSASRLQKAVRTLHHEDRWQEDVQRVTDQDGLRRGRAQPVEIPELDRLRSHSTAPAKETGSATGWQPGIAALAFMRADGRAPPPSAWQLRVSGASFPSPCKRR